MKRLAWLAFAPALAALAALTALACSSETAITDPGEEEEKDAGTFVREGSTYDSTPSAEAGLGELLFRPDTLYTGYDGTHTFVAPVAVYDSDSDLEVTASDPSAVTITPKALVNPVDPSGVTDNGKYFFITAKKAASITLTAKSKGRSTTATLTITDYAAGRWAAGDTRYKAAGSGADQACTNCHVNGQAIDHSPATMSSATDQDIGIIITTGIKPPSTPIVGVEGGHKWNVTADEKDGLVTYLRALQPKGFK